MLRQITISDGEVFMLYLTDDIDAQQILSPEINTILFKFENSQKPSELTNKIVLYCEDNDLDCKEFKLVFFRATTEFRKNSIESTKDEILFSDSTTWELFDELQKNTLIALNEQIEASFPGCRFSVNLSFGDYCLLIPADESPDLTEMYSWNDFVPFDKSGIPLHRTQEVETIRSRIRDKLDFRYIFDYLPFYGYKSDIFDELLYANVDTQDKIGECARLACVLLHYFTDEAAFVCFYANGESKIIDSDMRHYLNTVYNKLKQGIDLFTKEVSVNNIFSDIEWSFSFLNKALLFSVFGRSFSLGEFEDRDKYDNFHGFIPLISTNMDLKTLSSYFADEFGTSYKFAFLEIPYALTMDFYGKLPALLHEFSHYIPPLNRDERNQTVLKLTFFSVLNEPLQIIKRSNPDGQVLINQIVNSMIRRYNYLYETTLTIKDNIKDKELHDSMFFLHQTLDLFEAIDFNYVYSGAYLLHDIPDSVTDVLREFQESCVQAWNDCSQSYLITYMMALREIRSDIAMVTFLFDSIKLKDYVRLMASEPKWADQSYSSAADSVFLRLGFMSRFLFALEHDRHDYDTDSFNQSWLSEMKECFDQVVLESVDLTGRIDHMREYIDRYIEISFDYDYDEINQEYRSIGGSVFENALFGKENGVFDKNIIEPWIEQFNSIEIKKSLFKNLELQYIAYKNAKNDEERVMMNNRARLVFRDLFSVFPDVDLE